LEGEIFGEWAWEPGCVAGVREAESSRLLHGRSYNHPDAYLRGEGLFGEQTMWLRGVGEGRHDQGKDFGSTSVNDEFMRWGVNVPRTELVQHVPGFTILDNVIMFSGTFYVVTDDLTSMPPAEVIGSSRVNHNSPPRDIDWQVFLARDAPRKFGSYGGRIHGVTFVSYDGTHTTDPHTLLSLMRLYSTLNISSPHSLSPPHRLLFPSVPTFADPRPDPDDESILRHRSNIGVAPETLKAAYPSLAGAQFAEDFADFAGIALPVVLDRVVVADRGAARHGGVSRGTPPWAGPFLKLRASEDWFEPMRRSLSECLFGEDEGGVGGASGNNAPAAAATRTITYLSRQEMGADGERLRASDHAALLGALENLARTGVRVYVLDEYATWTERMRAIAQSTVVLSVFGDHVADAVFMKRTPRSTLMEIFPRDEFNRDWETVVRSMGIRYVAWRDNRQYIGENLPEFSQSSTYDDVELDAQAVVSAITEELNRPIAG